MSKAEMNSEQREFESWATEQGFDLQLCKKFGSAPRFHERYRRYATRTAALGWCAAGWWSAARHSCTNSTPSGSQNA